MPENLTIRGATVVACDPATPDLLDGEIRVVGGRIEYVGPITESDTDTTVLRADGLIVLPGFVDAHQHVWETPYAQQHPDMSLRRYFADFVTPAAAAVSPEELHQSITHALRLALASGTTSTMDWSHATNSPEHVDASIDAGLRSGSRYVFGYGPPVGLGYYVNDAPHPADLRRAAKAWVGRSRFGMMAALRGPDLSSPERYRADIQASRDLGLGISMHIGTRRVGPGGVARLEAEGLLGSDMQFVHGTDCSQEELHAIASSGASLVIPPIAELLMATGQPPFSQALQAGVLIALGIDTVIGGPGDMFNQMRATALLQRQGQWIDDAPPEGSTALEVLRWATQGGASALGLGDEIGSVSQGKAADLIFYRPTTPVRSLQQAAAEVLWNGSASNVIGVMVAGEFVHTAANFEVEDRRP